MGFINSLVYLDEFHTYVLSPVALQKLIETSRYQLSVFLAIWFSIGILIIGVVLLSIKKPVASKPRVRSDSVTREEGDSTTTYPPISPAVEREDEPPIPNGQGWLARRFGFFGAKDGRKELRGRKGNERLPDDADSIFTPLPSHEIAEELRRESLDPFGDDRDESKEVVFDERRERRESGDWDAGGEGAGDGREEDGREEEFGEFEEVDDYSAVQIGEDPRGKL